MSDKDQFLVKDFDLVIMEKAYDVSDRSKSINCGTQGVRFTKRVEFDTDMDLTEEQFDSMVKKLKTDYFLWKAKPK